MFPDLVSPDPYCQLLDGALRRRGVDVRRGRQLDPAFAQDAVDRMDVVHLHWIELLFWPGGRTPLRRLASMHSQARRTTGALEILHDAGVRIVWTVHNPPSLPESSYPGVHRRLQRDVVQTADTVIVHSRHAATEVQRLLSPPAPVRVVPHGGYAGVYPVARESRAQTRRRLGLPADAFVYLMFGTIRDYKRVPEAISSFRLLSDRDARLLMAGTPAIARAATERAAAGDPRVRLELRTIPDHEVAELFGAADAFVLNYAEVFSSGALLLALAFGLPIVAPERGSAAELAPPPATIPFPEGGLSEALAQARVDHDRRRSAARAAALVPSWDRTATLLEDAYRESPVRATANADREVIRA
jgi:glycosyltransferase involved in cell wall biosynthesis